MNEMFWHKVVIVWGLGVFTLLILATVGLAFVDAMNKCVV